jgi:hypothetical protein
MYKSSSLASKLGYMPDIDLFWTAMTQHKKGGDE